MTYTNNKPNSFITYNIMDLMCIQKQDLTTIVNMDILSMSSH